MKQLKGNISLRARIINLETSMPVVLEQPKVISPLEQKQVEQALSVERGSLVETVGIITFQAVNLELFNKSGQNSAKLFMDVLRHIGTKYNLIFIDNNDTHISVNSSSLTVNGILLLSFPRHTSHKLQPLDVVVFALFKSYFKKLLHNFMINHPSQRSSFYDVAELKTSPFFEATLNPL